VPHGQVTVFGDVGDHPAVPVFHPVRGRESESSIVAAGDDDISDLPGFRPLDALLARPGHPRDDDHGIGG
jgi:hypothetical protein